MIDSENKNPGNPSRPQRQRVPWLRSAWRAFLAVLLLFAGLFFLAMIIGNITFIQAGFAMLAGWLIHLTRVLPGLLSQWQAAVVPLACVILAWWTAHRLLRWWFLSRGSAIAGAWTVLRTGAVLALLLLGGAAAIAVSGIAHQAMWLGQTDWIQSNRRSELTMAMNNARQLMLVLVEYDHDHGRLPESWDEVFHWNDTINAAVIIQLFGGRDGKPAIPMLARPGAILADLNPQAILLVSDIIEGYHVVGRADASVTRLAPDALEQNFARSGHPSAD
jgi:hypothetical protein